ncbi:MAG TPA: hypothetical protein VGM63_22250 [Mucilaginibacter sp.]|jgi:hypothetical protein
MKTNFYIVLNLKTVNGFERYSRFYVGNDRDFAYNLFAKMQGSENIREEDILHLDLMETVNGLPFNLKVLNCTLAELGENCKIITKEIFKHTNLDEI